MRTISILNSRDIVHYFMFWDGGEIYPHIKKWLDENCQKHYVLSVGPKSFNNYGELTITHSEISFVDEGDATLFQLIWL